MENAGGKSGMICGDTNVGYHDTPLFSCLSQPRQTRWNDWEAAELWKRSAVLVGLWCESIAERKRGRGRCRYFDMGKSMKIIYKPVKDIGDTDQLDTSVSENGAYPIGIYGKMMKQWIWSIFSDVSKDTSSLWLPWPYHVACGLWPLSVRSWVGLRYSWLAVIDLEIDCDCEICHKSI